jgi:hypothetical protein
MQGGAECLLNYLVAIPLNHKPHPTSNAKHAAKTTSGRLYCEGGKPRLTAPFLPPVGQDFTLAAKFQNP